MAENIFQNKYRILSARAAWHDYSCGIYFVTICTVGRKHYFGEIVSCGELQKDAINRISTEPQMALSEIGKCAIEYLNNVTVHYTYAEIPLFVVMPNHIHAIVVIDGEEPVETVRAPSLQKKNRWKASVVDEKMQTISGHKGKLSVVIGVIKSAVTKQP